MKTSMLLGDAKHILISLANSCQYLVYRNLLAGLV